jgi:hypothetical protein
MLRRNELMKGGLHRPSPSPPFPLLSPPRSQVSQDLSQSHFINLFAFAALNNLTVGEEDQQSEETVLQNNSGPSIYLHTITTPQWRRHSK